MNDQDSESFVWIMSFNSQEKKSNTILANPFHRWREWVRTVENVLLVVLLTEVSYLEIEQSLRDVCVYVYVYRTDTLRLGTDLHSVKIFVSWWYPKLKMCLIYLIYIFLEPLNNFIIGQVI